MKYQKNKFNAAAINEISVSGEVGFVGILPDGKSKSMKKPLEAKAGYSFINIARTVDGKNPNQQLLYETKVEVELNITGFLKDTYQIFNPN